MQGKMKSFFEDTGIILVLSATIYGGYYLYTTFPNDTPNIKNTKSSQEKIVIKQDDIVDLNKSKFSNESNLTKTFKKEDEQVNKKIEIIEKSIEKKEIVKVPTPAVIKEEVEIKKEKNVDLGILRSFLRNLKFEMASNIVKRHDINETISQELKIRVTVLKDGTYEELLFVSGDKKLFEMNKENIAKVFPVRIDDKIKDDFPRYVRISIK